MNEISGTVFDEQKKSMAKEKEIDIAKVLSTPRELCKTCWEWFEGDENSYPCCVNGHEYECHNYLLGVTDTCKFYFEY